MADGSVFCRRVFGACQKIPRGKVSTYKSIAQAIGEPRAARAVGNALGKSPGMPAVPCHRVVKSDGRIGGFAWGASKKACMLCSEGVEIVGGRVDLRRHYFRIL